MDVEIGEGSNDLRGEGKARKKEPLVRISLLMRLKFPSFSSLDAVMLRPGMDGSWMRQLGVVSQPTSVKTFRGRLVLHVSA